MTFQSCVALDLTVPAINPRMSRHTCPHTMRRKLQDSGVTDQLPAVLYSFEVFNEFAWRCCTEVVLQMQWCRRTSKQVVRMTSGGFNRRNEVMDLMNTDEEGRRRLEGALSRDGYGSLMAEERRRRW